MFYVLEFLITRTMQLCIYLLILNRNNIFLSREKFLVAMIPLYSCVKKQKTEFGHLDPLLPSLILEFTHLSLIF